MKTDETKLVLRQEICLRKYDGDPPKEGESKLPVEINLVTVMDQKIVSKIILTDPKAIQEYEVEHGVNNSR